MNPPKDYVTREDRIPTNYDPRTAEVLAWVFGACTGVVTGVVGTLLYLKI